MMLGRGACGERREDMSQYVLDPVRARRPAMAVSTTQMVWVCIVAGIAIYFGTALWLERTWQDPAPKGHVVAPLVRPFLPLGQAAFRAEPLLKDEGLAALADNPDIEGDTRSPVIVYEDNKPLGPSHSTFAEVSAGHGRFAHWKGQGIVFSASDGSDPNTNGRRYWAVIAAK
ncbi:hypothetical protein [Bradyrhizobium ivorense]|uniref:hypothetical protein n=1 Tax=Bradyrhizobium ivorense TaxID=2511166 RepID=UPI00155ABA31|nr:hypothetical protein [Bradyrhizobium ivorense]